MTSILRKLAVPCVLSVLPVAQAALVTVTMSGTITSADVGSNPNDFLADIVGKSWSYQLTFDDQKRPSFWGQFYPHVTWRRFNFSAFSTPGIASIVTLDGVQITPPSVPPFSIEINGDYPSGWDDYMTFRTSAFSTDFSVNGFNFGPSDYSGWYAYFYDSSRTAITQTYDSQGLETVESIIYTTLGNFDDMGFEMWGWDDNGESILLLGNVTSLHFAPAVVPEPASFAALAGVGVLGFAALRRRRARR